MFSIHRVLVLGVLALGGVCAQAQTKPGKVPDANKPAATVNGEVITFGDLDPVFRSWPVPETLTEGDRRDLQRDALQSLIEDLVMDQFLSKNAPEVKKSEIDERMSELQLSQKQQGKTLADLGQTEAQLRRTISRQIQWMAYVKNKLQESELQKFYTDNKPFFDHITVRASHIALRVAPNHSPAEKEMLRRKLQDIRADIVAKKIEFADAAKKHSHCPTAPEGGDIGFFPLKFVVDENVARIAFGLKIGEMSDVIETDYGWHLIKVTDRKAGHPSDYRLVKDDVREFFIEEMHNNVVKQQMKVAKIEVHLP